MASGCCQPLPCPSVEGEPCCKADAANAVLPNVWSGCQQQQAAELATVAASNCAPGGRSGGRLLTIHGTAVGACGTGAYTSGG